MNEEPFTSSGGTTTEAFPGAPNQTGSPLEQKADQVAQSAQFEAQRIKASAREQGTAAMEQLKSGVQSATAQAQEAGRSFIQNQQQNFAQKVSEYARAVRSASECMTGEETNLLASPARRAADQLERVSSFLRDKEPSDLVVELESFARRRPEVVFGGLFIAGLAAARFLKASGKRARDRELRQYNEWSQPSYAAPQESIVPAPTTPVPDIPNPSSAMPSSSVASGITGTSTTPGISTMPDVNKGTSTGSSDCGCSTL